MTGFFAATAGKTAITQLSKRPAEVLFMRSLPSLKKATVARLKLPLGIALLPVGGAV